MQKPESIALTIKRPPDSLKEEKYFKKPKFLKSEKHSALDEIIKMEEENREKKNRADHWLTEGIVVKFREKTLGEKFYKQKAVVLQVIDKYQAKIKFLSSGDKVKVDQVQ